MHRTSIALATALAFACSDLPPEPPAPNATTDPFVASLAEGQAGSDLIAYISLPPETMPAGGSITLRLARNGAVAMTELVDGGFDPVPFSARVGDTVVVSHAAWSPDGRWIAFTHTNVQVIAGRGWAAVVGRKRVQRSVAALDANRGWWEPTSCRRAGEAPGRSHLTIAWLGQGRDCAMEG